EGGRSSPLGASQLATGGAPILDGRRQPSCDGTSRMTRECQVRICEGLGVKFPGPTRHLAPAPNPDLQQVLLGVLRDLGYVEGQNLAIEYRFMLGQSKTYDELAAELARLAPDAIVVVGTPPALATKRQTNTIPIIMAPAADPLRTGLVASLSRPGSNVTGVSL